MVEFTSCCRSYGLRVSTSEVIDCICHLRLVNPLDEKEFRTVLQSNYAKSRRDQSRFNLLYDLFFHGVKPLNSMNTFTHLAGTFNKIIDMVEKNQSNDPADTISIKTDNANNEPTKKALTEFMRGRPAKS